MSTQEKPTPVSGMFEDIKRVISKLSDKITEFIAVFPEKAGDAAELQKILDALSRIEPQKEFSAEQLTTLKDIASTVAHFIKKSVSEKTDAAVTTITELLNDISERLDNITAQLESLQEKVTTHRRLVFAIDFQNHKAVTTMLLMVVIIFCSLSGNVQQCSTNRQYRDNDIKYRYIRMSNGISPEEIYRLEGFFNDPDSTFVVKQIRRWVLNYEENVRKQIAVPGQCFPILREQEAPKPVNGKK